MVLAFRHAGGGAHYDLPYCFSGNHTVWVDCCLLMAAAIKHTTSKTAATDNHTCSGHDASKATSIPEFWWNIRVSCCRLRSNRRG